MRFHLWKSLPMLHISTNVILVCRLTRSFTKCYTSSMKLLWVFDTVEAGEHKLWSYYEDRLIGSKHERCSSIRKLFFCVIISSEDIYFPFGFESPSINVLFTSHVGSCEINSKYMDIVHKPLQWTLIWILTSEHLSAPHSDTLRYGITVEYK